MFLLTLDPLTCLSLLELNDGFISSSCSRSSWERDWGLRGEPPRAWQKMSFTGEDLNLGRGKLGYLCISYTLNEQGITFKGLKTAIPNLFMSVTSLYFTLSVKSISFTLVVHTCTCIWGENRAGEWVSPPHTGRWGPRRWWGSRAWPRGGRHTAPLWSEARSVSESILSHVPSVLDSMASTDLLYSLLAPWNR